MSRPLIQDDQFYFAALLEHRTCYPALNPLEVMDAAADQDITALQAARRRQPDAYLRDRGPRLQELIGLMACRNDWQGTLSWAMQLKFDPFQRVMVIPGRNGADSSSLSPWLEALDGGSINVITQLAESEGPEILRDLVLRHQNKITPLMHLFATRHTAAALQILDIYPDLLEQSIKWHPTERFTVVDYVQSFGRDGQSEALRSWVAAKAARTAISEISGLSALAVP